MIPEQKKLLIQDLSERHPYGVKVEYGKGPVKLSDIVIHGDLCTVISLADSMDVENVRPYLRPLSSMTNEEMQELKNITCPNGTAIFDEKYLICPISHFGEHISYKFMSEILSWLKSKHFDYRGLIDLGLAIAVTEDNNPYKN